MLDKSLVDETIEVMEETAFQRDYFAELAVGGLFASIILKTQCQQKDMLINSFERNSPKHVKQKVLKEFNGSPMVKVLSDYVESTGDDPMFSHFTELRDHAEIDIHNIRFHHLKHFCS